MPIPVVEPGLFDIRPVTLLKKAHYLNCSDRSTLPAKCDMYGNTE